MDKIRLQILGISSGHSTSSYTLILEEENGDRKLPVVIGAPEAQAIAIQIEKIKPPRPMTHDLFLQFAAYGDIKVSEVIINKIHEGVFHASLLCSKADGESFEIDARTSDAIAIALRFKCEIYTYPSIMDEAGIILSESGESTDLGDDEFEDEFEDIEEDKPRKRESLNELEVDELKEKLDQAIEEENYILAAKIRDELKKREE